MAAPDDPLAGINYSGGRVFVRNTFLDLDDAPRMPELERLKTAPAVMKELVDSDDETETDAGEQADQVADLGGLSEQTPSAAVDAPPAADQLYRSITCDGWEQNREWMWGNDPNLSPASDRGEALECVPEPAPQDAAPQQPQQQMGFMLVPANMCGPAPPPLPQGCVGIGTLGSVPAGCLAVPIDPFARWPGGAMPAGMMPMMPNMMPPGTIPVGMIPAEMPAPCVNVSDAPGGLAPSGGYAPPSAPVGPAGTSSALPASAPAPPNPPLTRAFSVNSGIYRVHWTVDARKLKSNDKVAVSPQFEVSFGTAVPFKMLIHPKYISEGKGGGSFRKAKGRGKIELKCEGVVEGMSALVRYRLSIGSGRAGDTSKVQKPRPLTYVEHNFANSGVSGLPKESDINPDGEEWNFLEVVDDDSQTFVVCLEIMSGPPPC